MSLAFLTNLKGRFLHLSRAELVKKYQQLLILVAITAITYALAGLCYDVLSFTLLKSRAVRPTGEVPVSLNALQRAPADAYAVIPQRNLFGSTDKAVADKKLDAAAPVEGPDFATLLEVKGTVAGTGKDGFAIIEEKANKKQQLYKVGNVVAGAKVVKITRNAVTFLVGDKERVLKMNDTNQAPLLPPRPSSAPIAVSPRSAAAGPMVVTRNDVDSQLKDMGTMLSQAQIRPYYADGVPDGFMITNIKPGSIYEKIGLTNGDIVQGTNDRRLVTADDMTALYNSMKAGSSLTLKIKRGSQQQNLQYVIQ